MAFIFIICALLLLLPDVYILFCVISKAAWWTKILFLLPTLAYFFVMIRMFVFGDMRQIMLNLLFWLTLCVVFPTVIFTVVSLLGKGLAYYCGLRYCRRVEESHCRRGGGNITENPGCF